MKKLFLTSGLVLCMACPAFADPIQGTPTATDECVQDVLGVTSGSATLDAIWTANQYSINFAAGTAGTRPANYVTGTTAPVSPVTWDNENIPLTSNGFSAVGYDFAGWTSTSNLETGAATPTSYDDGDTLAQYRIADSSTLTATWTPKKYTVVYDKGAHAADGVVNYTHTNGATFDANYVELTGGGANAQASETGIYAAPGYTFVGWNTATDQTTANWSGAAPWTTDAGLTVYAAYTANGYTITYDCGGPAAGSQSQVAGPTMPSQGVTMDGAYTLAAADNCSLPGYTFAGWSCPYLNGVPTLPAGNPQYFAGGATGTYSYAGDVTCTAQWTKNNIDLNWNTNGATSGEINPTSCIYDEGITLPAEPTKTGYTFGGWEVQTQTQNP